MSDKCLMVFDDLASFLHLFLGFIVRKLKVFCWWLALAIFVIFWVYEGYEAYRGKDSYSLLGDLMEWVVGYLVADIVPP